MQLLFDLFPVVAFFVAFKLADIYVATGVLIVAVVIQMAIQWTRHKRVSSMALTSAALVFVFGGLTLWLRDESLIKWKVSVVNWLFAAVFLGSHFIGERPLVQRIMGSAITMDPAHWRRLNALWVAFFFVLGTVNYYVMTRYTTDVWAAFKLYGIFGLTAVFLIIQAWWLATKIDDEAGAKDS